MVGTELGDVYRVVHGDEGKYIKHPKPFSLARDYSIAIRVESRDSTQR